MPTVGYTNLVSSEDISTERDNEVLYSRLSGSGVAINVSPFVDYSSSIHGGQVR